MPDSSNTAKTEGSIQGSGHVSSSEPAGTELDPTYTKSTVHEESSSTTTEACLHTVSDGAAGVAATQANAMHTAPCCSDICSVSETTAIATPMAAAGLTLGCAAGEPIAKKAKRITPTFVSPL